MTVPEDLPIDDSENTDQQDQQSQQDVHTTGIDPDPEELERGKEPSPDLLRQSYRAAEAASSLPEEDQATFTGEEQD